MTVSIKAEEVLDANKTLGFEISDLGESYALEIRRGIVQFYEYVPADADIVIQLPKDVVIGVVTGQTTYSAAVDSGDAKMKKGNIKDLNRFIGHFEVPDLDRIRLVAR